MDMAQSFQVAPEYVEEITFTTKVSSIEPNSGIDKYRRNQVSNQHYNTRDIIACNTRDSTCVTQLAYT